MQLVVSDDHEGLKNAIERHFHGASWPRDASSTTRGIFSAWWATPYARNSERISGRSSPLRAGSRPSLWRPRSAQKWRGPGHKKVAEHLEEHIEECLSCLALPESHQRRIRTTNDLERLNQEIKKRTRVVRIFPNWEACLRLVTALCVEQSEEWITGRRYLDMGELEQRPPEKQAAEEVMLMER